MAGDRNLIQEAIGEVKTMRRHAIENAKQILIEEMEPVFKAQFNKVMKEAAHPDRTEFAKDYEKDTGFTRKGDSTTPGPGADNVSLADMGDGPAIVEDAIGDEEDQMNADMHGDENVDEEDKPEGDEELYFDEMSMDEDDLPIPDEEEVEEVEQSNDLELPDDDMEEVGHGNIEVIDDDDEVGDGDGDEDDLGGDEEVPVADDEIEDEPRPKRKAPVEIPAEESNVASINAGLRESLGRVKNLNLNLKKENALLRRKMYKVNEQFSKAQNAITYMRDTIKETNLLNARLAGAARVMKRLPLTKKEQDRVIETFDNCNSINEVKRTYKVIVESFNLASRPKKTKFSVKPKNISPVSKLDENSNSNKNNGDSTFDRWQLLSGIKTQ